MIRRPLVQVLTAALVLAIAAGCSKKEIPKEMKAVPADATVVATLDAKALLAYAKDAAAKLIPAELSGDVPAFEEIAKQAKEMIGIDLDKLSQVMLIGYVGSDDQVAFVARGVDVKALKGNKESDHGGVPLFSMEEGIHYAGIQGVGVVAGPSQAMVKKILDAHAGKAKNIGSTKKADMLKELAAIEKGLDQFRVYVLTGDLPDAGPMMFQMDGGGFFLHLDKGVAVTLVSENAGELKSNLDQGLMMLQMAMSGGGDMGLPMDMDEKTKAAITDLMKKLKTDKSGNTVSVLYHGDLKPLVALAVGLAMEEMKGELQAEEPDTGNIFGKDKRALGE